LLQKANKKTHEIYQNEPFLVTLTLLVRNYPKSLYFVNFGTPLIHIFGRS